MSFLDLTTTRELVASDLSDAAFQEVIDLEEAWLAKRIGPLDGERTERFVNVRYGQLIRLQRPTDADSYSFAVDDAGTDATADVELRRNGWRVARLHPAGWLATGALNGAVSITYEPNDALEVERVLVELVRLSIAATQTPNTGITSEVIGSYTYVLGTGSSSPRSIRAALLRSLREPLEPETLRVRSSTIPEPIGIAT
jgi:hypothetical protein